MYNKKNFGINLNFDSFGEAYGWPKDFKDDKAYTKGLDRITKLCQKLNIPITIFIKDYYLKGNINKIIPILIILAVMMSNSRGSILALIIICILYFIIFLKVSHITKIVYGSIFFGIGTIIISQSPYYYSLIEYLFAYQQY